MQFRPSLGFWRLAKATALCLVIACQGAMPNDGEGEAWDDDESDQAMGGDGNGEFGGSGPQPIEADADGGVVDEPDNTDADAMATSNEDASPSTPDAVPQPSDPNLKPAIIAAGYGALRLVSFDGGRTWKNRVVNNPNGGDDNNLIRAITYADGLWVAVGWKIFLSEDGVKWTEIPDSTVPGGWYDCATFQDGMHIVKTIRADRGGQNGPAIFSKDRGKTWQEAKFTTRCTPPSQPLPDETASLRSAWKGKIERATSGSNWQTVHTDCCSVSMFAKGFAAEN